MNPLRINKLKKYGIAGLILLFQIITPFHAISASGNDSLSGLGINTQVLLGMAILVLVMFFALLVCISALKSYLAVHGFYKRKVPKEIKEEQKVLQEKKVKISVLEKINKRFGAGEFIPVEKEREIMLEHSYDGISELNNHMPPWIKYIFYVTILFAIVYVLNYLILGTGESQVEEYHKELAIAEENAIAHKASAKNLIDETNVEAITDIKALKNAQAIYIQNCSPCHARDGGGTVGPNLTDKYWLHGGDIKDIFSVIKYGVQEKGMIPWEGKLKPEEIRDISSYILTLQGTSPAAPKEPQGEEHVEENTEEENIGSL